MSRRVGGQQSGKTPLKVIASSIRKGNVIEQDGKLYVVLTAENIHPGKGTPVSQIEMRRIGDGVKISERYKTTDQVEKATIEDHNFNYLYQDADGFHFMNTENYDQVQVSKEIIGSAAPYLQENMTVKLALHDMVPVAITMPSVQCMLPFIANTANAIRLVGISTTLLIALAPIKGMPTASTSASSR